METVSFHLILVCYMYVNVSLKVALNSSNLRA